MIGSEEIDAFVSRSQTAIVTTVRTNGSPSSSMIGFARVGDRLLFSSTVDGVRGRTLARDPRAAMCVINENEPNAFAAVEGTVTIHTDNPTELHEQMFAYRDGLVDHFPMGFWATAGHEAVGKMWAEPGRAVYELTPTRVSGMIV